MGVLLVDYESVRSAVCAVCHSVFEQRSAGVAVVCEGRPLGDLCPRCLACPELEWDLSLDDLRAAERSALRRWCPGLTDDDLRRLVDDSLDGYLRGAG
jgi:hypothetical protein